MGAGLGQDVACLTDGRFSGGYVLGFFVGKELLVTCISDRTVSALVTLVCSLCLFCQLLIQLTIYPVPEAQVGGPIALVQDGDIISVDAIKNTIELRVASDELDRRRQAWVAPSLKTKQGTLFKYVKTVTDASHGCVTDA